MGACRTDPRRRTRLSLVRAALCVLAAGTAGAQVPAYEGCADAAGRTVASELDRALTQVAAARLEGGQPVIRHNPEALPRLTPRARLFFYAHECARHTLGQALDTARTPQAAQRADCVAVVGLADSGLLGRDEVAQLQSELRFAPQDWALLPGPARSFDLEACFRTAPKLPSGEPPAAGQVEWNACIRGCGDRLLRCQRGCRDGGCEARCVNAYEGCDEACGRRFPR